MDKTGDVLSHICAVMSSLSPSEKAIATYVLDHPSDVAAMTVRELAAETGTSPASASRFARTLDYRTYSDMRLALGISISRASGEEKATGGKVTLDDIEGSIKYVLSHKVKELAETTSLIDSDDFAAVVTLLHNANLVLVAGVGNTINMGANAAFKFSQVGVRAFCPSTTEAMASVATNLTENDVLLVISTSGYSKRLVNLFDSAEDSNTPIVMITDSPDTPLAKRATHIIRAVSRDQAITGSEIYFSHNSINFIIELLFLFLVSCWDDPLELNRIISKNLLGDRQYS